MIDLQRMLACLRSGGKLCILTHNNPDPDAIAGAWGLKFLIESRSPCRVTIAYDGIVSRTNNREMVRLLQIPMTRLAEIDLAAYERLGIVDSQPGQGNNPFPTGRRPFIVVDHHPWQRPNPDADFFDLRAEAGSTAAIVCEYLRASGLEIPSDLATSLYYGIKTDTDGLSRDCTQLDKEMFHELFPWIDPEKLVRIEKPDLPREYFHDIGDAVLSARIYGTALVSDLGPVWSPEMPAEMAEFLLRMEGVCTTMAFGVYGEKICFSLRSSRSGLNLGEVALQLVKGQGTAGGHNSAAGGQLPATPENCAALPARFLACLKLDGHPYTTIFDPPTPQG